MVQDTRLIELKDISKSFGDTEVLHHINLYIRKCEFVTLLGPSGCGKTTLLRLLGGFETPTSGQIFFDGADVANLPPYKRRINTVFQKYALFSHLNVFDNIAFGLNLKAPEAFGVKTRAQKKEEIRRRVDRMLKLVKMEGYENRSINQLSGGQQQRIAIARALVNEPEVLLLDEPLGALDQRLRKDMQLELKKMQQRLGITFLYVTHDQEEALTMSDTIVIMKGGHIQQIGKPKAIYDEPANAFVADFIGESNILDGVMERDCLVRFAGHEFTCVDGGFGANAPVDVVVRPEDVLLGEVGEGMLRGTVRSVLFKGVHWRMMVQTGDTLWKVDSTQMLPEGSAVGVSIVPDGIHIMHKMEEAAKE